MNTIGNAFIIGLAVLTISIGHTQDNQGIEKDLAQMQGEWSMVSGSADGQSMPETQRNQMKRICKGNETTTTLGDQVFMKAKFTLDPSKHPKTIDYQMTAGFTKGKTQLGIYEIKGDTFKACFAGPGEARPSDFSSKPGQRRTLAVWKRQKETPAQNPSAETKP